MSYWDPVSWNNNWLVDISGTTIIVPSSYGSFSRPIKILWEPYYTDFSAKLSTIQWRIFTNKTLLHDFGFCPNLSTVSLSHLVFSIKGYQLKKIRKAACSWLSWKGFANDLVLWDYFYAALSCDFVTNLWPLFLNLLQRLGPQWGHLTLIWVRENIRTVCFPLFQVLNNFRTVYMQFRDRIFTA